MQYYYYYYKVRLVAYSSLVYRLMITQFRLGYTLIKDFTLTACRSTWVCYAEPYEKNQYYVYIYIIIS